MLIWATAATMFKGQVTITILLVFAICMPVVLVMISIMLVEEIYKTSRVLMFSGMVEIMRNKTRYPRQFFRKSIVAYDLK